MNATSGVNLFHSIRADIKKLLLEHTLSVVFTKKDGTERTMLCTLKAEHLPIVEKREDNEAQTKKQNDESLAVWDLEKKSWRSFRIDSIVSHSVSNL